MATRHLYLARHGVADVFGQLTGTGRQQMELLGERLSPLPIAAIWHSPLPRATASAEVLSRHLPDATVGPAAELIDHVPYVPEPNEMPQSWHGFFDGYDPDEAAAGLRTATALTDRFASPPDALIDQDQHLLLITHDYPIAWLVRHSLDAPRVRWLGLSTANAALTMIDFSLGSVPKLIMYNDLSHLPEDLRWTGFGSIPGP